MASHHSPIRRRAPTATIGATPLLVESMGTSLLVESMGTSLLVESMGTSLLVEAMATPLLVESMARRGNNMVEPHHQPAGEADTARAQSESEPESSTQAEPLVAVYRHDVHKLRGRPHATAADEYAGVHVNEPVPLDADRDAARLSRPPGDPEQTVTNHASPYRLSLLTGETAVETERIQAAADGGFRDLVTPSDPEHLHARWLTSDVPGAFSESMYYPYTSVQYHTLLTAALLENYRAGHEFADISLVATPTNGTVSIDETSDAAAALAADDVEPHRTILWTPTLALHLTATPADRPATRLGNQPARSFADAWSRLPAHPLDVDDQRRWRLLDAQLRRIRSWSVALAYIDEFVTAQTWTDPGGAWP